MKIRICLSSVPRETDLRKSYYHGTSADHIEDIIKYGLVAPIIKQPKRLLAPQPGKIYITPNLVYACIYAVGANMIGRELPESYCVGAKRYGYLCVIDGKSLLDVSVDEDSIGELVYGKTLPWLNNIARNVVVERTYKKVMEGEYAQWAKIGKIIIKKLNANQIYCLIDAGAHIAHDGNLKPSEIWKFDKLKNATLDKDCSNFFALATRVL